MTQHVYLNIRMVHNNYNIFLVGLVAKNEVKIVNHLSRHNDINIFNTVHKIQEHITRIILFQINEINKSINNKKGFHIIFHAHIK